MLFAVFSSAQLSVTMLFAVLSSVRYHALCGVFERPDVRYHAICGVFMRPDVRYHAICGVFKRPDVRYQANCGVFMRPDVRYHAICGVFRRPGCPRRATSVLQTVDFPATEAPRVRGVLGVLRLCYKSRLSSHGSSACPWRTTFVLQKSTFQPRKLRASPAYYVCTTKLDFPATEVPGVLRLYYTVEKQTQKTQKHYGFSTATTRKPAEGLRLHVKKRKNTRVSAPRQRRKPQRGYVCMSKNAKTPRFWHRANAETRRGLSAATKKSTKNDGFSTATRRSPAEGCPRPQRNVKKRRFWHRDHAETRRGLSAQIKKRKKTTVLAPRPRRNPQKVAIPIGDVNPARRLRKSNFNLEI